MAVVSTLPEFAESRKDNRNSSQRRTDNMVFMADGEVISVIYNGSMTQDVLHCRDFELGNREFYLDDGTQLTKDYVYAVNPKARVITLRLKNTRGILPQ